MDSPMLANGIHRVRPGRRLSLRQVVDLQKFSFEAAKGLSADFQETTDKEERARVASAISNLAKGWVSLQDAKREILGRPRAGVRKHAVEKHKRREVVAPLASWSSAAPASPSPAAVPTDRPAETPFQKGVATAADALFATAQGNSELPAGTGK